MGSCVAQYCILLALKFQLQIHFACISLLLVLVLLLFHVGILGSLNCGVKCSILHGLELC